MRIVGGSTAAPGTQPWYVLLLVCNTSKTSCQRCGATVISHKHLLTAAHCFFDPENWYIELFPSVYSEPTCSTPHIAISVKNGGKLTIQSDFSEVSYSGQHIKIGHFWSIKGLVRAFRCHFRSFVVHSRDTHSKPLFTQRFRRVNIQKRHRYHRTR